MPPTSVACAATRRRRRPDVGQASVPYVTPNILHSSPARQCAGTKLAQRDIPPIVRLMIDAILSGGILHADGFAAMICAELRLGSPVMKRGDMLSDTALIVTGVAFVSILGGAWALRRRAHSGPAAFKAPVTVREPGVRGDALQEKMLQEESLQKKVQQERAWSHTPAAAAGGRDGGPAGSRQAEMETLVLRAAVEDALERLVDVYGPEYLDAFYARRVRRNVEPYRRLVEVAGDTAMARESLRQAAAAEQALQSVVAAVRSNPKI